jgi:hypothetical protein
MTPKEKAFELAHKFRLLEIRTSENSHIMISMADAKQCALIAVDEVINTIMSVYQPETKAFWFEVKKEIEKL